MLATAYAIVSFAVVATMLWSNDARGRLSKRSRVLIDAAVVLAAIGLSAVVLERAVSNVREPRPWDFPHFYMVARAAFQGRDFYDPQVLREVYRQLMAQTPVPADWLAEAGYWYLPPAALLLLPLGGFGYRTALALHYGVQAALLCASVAVLRRVAAPRQGRMGAVQILVLILAFRPTISMVTFAQIVFGSLFFLALAMHTLERRPVAAGWSLAGGLLYKHLLLVPGLFAVFLGRISTALATVLGILVALAVSVAIFGAHTCLGFLRFGPSGRPAALAVDPVIQSLQGLCYRLLGQLPSAPGAWEAILYPPFLAVAAAFTLATIAVCRRPTIDSGHLQAKFSLVVILSLLCYPNTLFSTLPLMLPTFLVLYAQRARLAVPRYALILFIASQYAWVSAVKDWAVFTLVATWALLLWVLAGSSFREARAEPEAQRSFRFRCACRPDAREAPR